MTTVAPSTESNSGAHEELPSWAIPPERGFTADDLDRIPELPPHTELIDGSLVFVSPQARFQMLVVRLLDRVLCKIVPDNLEVAWMMTVTLDDRQRLEPDVLVAKKDAGTRENQTTYRPEDVALVVEVVSPESETRDRERKPVLYAKAGIPHMWRIEKVDGKPVVYTFELEPATHMYVPTGVHHDRLKTTVPFDIDIDLTELYKS